MVNLYALLLIIITAAVILARRSMYAILNLILLFVLIALVVISLKVDFIGLIFIIVYVGAIATLFLFITMMLGGEDWKTTSLFNGQRYQSLCSFGFRSSTLLVYMNRGAWYIKHVFLDILLLLGAGLVLIHLFNTGLTANITTWLSTSDTLTNYPLVGATQLYGSLFYNHWFIPFIIAGIVLLIAMLGSIILTTRLLMVEAPIPKSESQPKTQLEVRSTNGPLLGDHFKKQQHNERAALRSLPLHLGWLALCIVMSVFLQPTMLAQSQCLHYNWLGGWVMVYLLGLYAISRWYRQSN